MKPNLFCIVSALLLLPASGPVRSQESQEPAEQASEEEPVATSTVIELVDLPEDGLDQLWIEVLPLRGTAPAELFRLGDRKPADGEEDAPPPRVEPTVPRGPALVCLGAEGLAVTCERHFIYPDVERDGPLVPDTEDPGAPPVEMTPVKGLGVVGRVLQGGLAVPGTRVYVVPAEIEAERPVSLPLFPQSPPMPGTRRFAVTDEAGVFVVPPVAPGTYVVEAHLPTGQVHRVEAFDLPAPPEADPDPEGPPPYDLGDLVVLGGLSLEVLAVGTDGAAVPRASVTARQGDDPATWDELRIRTDEDGRAVLEGLSAESPVTVACAAFGRRSWEQDYELLPVTVECVLPALARVVGAVSSTPAMEDRLDREAAGAENQGLPAVLPGARVEVRPLDPDAGRTTTIPPASLDGEGRFDLVGLDPGSWRLEASAPGFEPVVQELTLEPGETLDVGLLFLPASPAIRGRVVAAEDGRPVAGAVVRSVAPAGAADTVSDAEGRFTVSATGDSSLTLLVAAEDRPAVRVTWSPEAQGQSGEKVVELPRGGFLRVLIEGEGVGPCVGCTVHVVAPESAQALSGPVPPLETDGAGEALSVPLAPGVYTVQRPRFAVRGGSVVETRDAEERFARVRPGEITTVRFDTAREILRLAVRPLERLGRAGLEVRHGGSRQRAIAEGNGVFRIKRPRAAPTDVFLLRWNGRTRFEDRIYLGSLQAHGPAAGSGASLATDLDIGLGAPASPTAPEEPPELVTMQLSGSGVHGRLETFDGERVGGVRVRLRDVAGDRFLAESRSDGEGIFRFDDTAPGVYSLWIGDRAFQFVSLLADREVDLGAFQLVPGAY